MNLKSIQTRMILLGLGSAVFFILVFAYIAYIDTEMILRIHVQNETIIDPFHPEKTVNEQIYRDDFTKEENIELAMDRLLLWYVVDLVIPIGIMAAIFYFLSRSITRSIRELKEIARTLKEGNLDKKIESTANDELKEVADILEEMRVSVKDKIEKINGLSEQRSKLFGQLTHDLKTPLVPIIALAPKLIEKEEDPKKKKVLEMMVSNSNRLYEIIKRVLSLLRLDSASFKLSITPENPTEFFEKIIQNNEYTIEQNNMKIERQFEESLPSVAIDKSYIAEVIENLITNAIKYSKDSSVLTFILKRKDDKVLFGVKDQGAGIPKEKLHNIFQEFYKADWSRHEASAGLGLSIAKRIIDAHKGEIYAESEGEGKGSTFIFTVPVIP